MRGGRLLLIVGVVVVIGALAVGGFLLFRPSPAPTPVGEGTPMPTPLPENEVRIVVAAQNIPRGMQVNEEDDAVVMQNWPRGTVPAGAVSQLEDTYGRVARVDIPLGMPILESMLAEEPGDLVAMGSNVALQIPEGLVAYAQPVGRYSSVAWALQPGDHVDVIISLLIVGLDEEFQTVQPNQARCLSPSEDEACMGMSGPMGRLEVLPNGWLVNLTPSEGQRPRLVTQLTVQNIRVLRVGDWPAPEALAAAGEPSAEKEEPAPEEEEEGAPPSRPDVESLTLAVTRQEAMVLDYAQAIGARINFVLRGVGDDRTPPTESVTLQYLMDRYNFELPPKLPYGVTPPISRLERIVRDESAAQYGPTGQSSE